MKKLEYHLASGSSAHDFHERIDYFLKEGYTPFGQPFAHCEKVVVKSKPDGTERMEYHTIEYCQAMVKEG